MSVKVTNKDIVLLGHVSHEGGSRNTRLPANIDLYLLPPPGYNLMINLAAALIDQMEIRQIRLSRDGNPATIIDVPFVEYLGDTDAPDLILQDLDALSGWGKRAIGDKKNVVTVGRATSLSELIASDPKILAALKELPNGEKLKLYWSACSNQISGYTAGLA